MEEDNNRPAPTAPWVRNLMPRPLRLRYVDAKQNAHEVSIAPLGEQAVEGASEAMLSALAERCIAAPTRLAAAIQDKADIFASSTVPALTLGIVASVMASNAKWTAFDLTGWHVLFGTAVAILVLLLAMAFALFQSSSASSARAWGLVLRHQFVFGLVLLAALGLPWAAFSMLVAAPDAWFGPIATHFASGNATGVGRLLLLSFVSAAAVFPGLLYFIYDRRRVDVVRESFERQIFRLDRHVRNLADVQARYGARLRELYGDFEQGGAGAKLRFGTRWPVLVGTCAVAGGWILVLLVPGAHVQVSGDSVASGLLKMFTPAASNFSFGFLGAYFFSLQLIARRYARGDLHPKTYSIIAARIFVVLISAWVVDVIWGSSPLTQAFLFLVGVLPEAIYLALREVLSQKVLGNWFSDVTSRLPLTHLPGIDLYDRARLEEEGITNIENLAHCDLVDLMLSTNVPAPQLVQWVDQAILYLRLREVSEEAPKALLDQLHAAGITRASDLMQYAFDASMRLQASAAKEVLATVKTLCGEPIATRVAAVAAALKADQWFEDIAHWRQWQQPAELCLQWADNEIRVQGADAARQAT